MKEKLPQQQATKDAEPDTQIPDGEPVKKPVTEKKPTKTDRLKTGPGWILSGVTLFILIGAGVGAGLFLWHSAQGNQLQLQAEMAAALDRVNKQSELVQSLQQELNRYRHNERQQQQQTQEKINNLQRQLSSQQKRLLSLSTTDRNDWLLAEAEYLLRLANQRLQMGKEIGSAQDLLKAADDIIRELDDHALYPVRQALAEEMAALHGASNIDLEGLYLQLGATAKQAAQLRLLAQLQYHPEPPPVQDADNWQLRAQVGLEAAWQKLGNLVQIRRRDDIYQPLLAPEFEAPVRQNIQLMFEQAQMALLAGNQRLYEQSLGKAKDWLNTYYTLDKDATDSVVAVIEQLQQQQVTIALPDISGSLRALKHYIELLHFTVPENKHGGNAAKSDGGTEPAEPLPSAQTENAEQAL